MKKGEESRQLLIECAAELLWKMDILLLESAKFSNKQTFQ